MATVKDHYAEVLSDIYSWMFEGFESGIRRNDEFIHNHQLFPRGSGIAVDLGAGCGFQSIPLARAGYSVTAIDLDENLLRELNHNSGNLQITTVQGDLIDFDQSIKGGVELIVCMTDTLIHLETREKVSSLFSKVFAALETGGKFIITYRDLTHELSGLERFIPVKSDDSIICTCFLEYEPETVKVHDIVYKKDSGQWHLFKSFYRKLRLSEEWVKEKLSIAGFKHLEFTVENGFILIIGSK